MGLKRWRELPKYMQTDAVYAYYSSLKKKKGRLAIKRGFDFTVAAIMLVILSPFLIALSIAVIVDSKGDIFFRQERVTQYGRRFRIFKFRTMVTDAEKLGPQVTTADDTRVTRVGKVLRKYRLDELPQLINIILGDMSFVGVRPEVPRFVRAYTPEMMATLLLPAGITSEASIQYRNEANLLQKEENADEVYINKVLPEKMKYNLKSIKQFSLTGEIRILIKTVQAVLH